MRFAVSILGVSVLAAAVYAQVAPQPDNVSVFMKQKLVHTQKILEGIVTEDYEMIGKHAQEVALLSQATQWQVLQTPEYHQQSLEFRRTADAIIRAAKDKDLDNAALQYVGLTLKCVQCHKYVRDVQMAQLELPDAPKQDFELK